MNIKIEESNGTKKYWVNGTAYDRLEDIPTEFKQYFSDRDNNGIPDQFDGLISIVNKMGGSNSFGSAFKSLLSTADIKHVDSPASSPVKTFSRGTTESPFTPTLVKIVFAGLIVSAIAWAYQNYQVKTTNDRAGTTIVSDSTYQIPVASPIPSDRLTFIIDDPNEPPYHMLGVVSQNGVKIFTFELPAGEEIESTDSTLQIIMPVKAGTNLIEKTFTLSLLNQTCTFEDESSLSTALIGNINFTKVENEEYGMSQTYQTYRYSFEKEGKCVIFMFTLHSGIPEAFDPQSKEFDLAEEVAEMENILKTIRFLDSSSN